MDSNESASNKMKLGILSYYFISKEKLKGILNKKRKEKVKNSA